MTYYFQVKVEDVMERKKIKFQTQRTLFFDNTMSKSRINSTYFTDYQYFKYL